MKNRRMLIVVVLIAVVAAVMVSVWLFSNDKIRPGLVEDASDDGFVPEKTVQAVMEKVTEWHEAVGTVRPRTETRIEAQVTAQVVDVRVSSGTEVNKGDILLTLDNRRFLSRLDQTGQGLKSAIAGKEQARQAVIAAQAAFDQAKSAYERIKTYFASQAATSQDLEKAEAAYLQAKAGLSKAEEALAGAEAGSRQAQEVVKEAEIALSYTTLRAPEDGKVLKRMVEPGDMALPGKPLMLLQTSGFLRLEAYVREGLIKLVKPGSTLSVKIDTLEKVVEGEVEEIVPYADPQTRTFLVKAALPRVEGIYPGMYGKLLIPVRERFTVLIPIEAVQHVGQLELVKVKEETGWRTRFVKIGRTIGGQVEILSGLNGHETLGL